MSNRPNNLAVGVPKHTPIRPQGPWVRRAACAGTDPNIWFVEDRTGSYLEARRICAACPVRRPCLDWALETNTFDGMFGGLSPHERRQLRTHQLALADTDDHRRFDDVRPKASYL